MSDPLSWGSGLIDRYGATIVGLTIGTAAKYGMMLSEGRKPRPSGLLADILLFGMLGLIALSVGDVTALFGVSLSINARVLSGALAAVGSDRLVRLVADRYFKKVEDSLPGALSSAPSVAAIVPAGTGMPDAVQAQPGTPDDPLARAGTSLKTTFRGTTRQRPPADQIELLRQLDPARPPRSKYEDPS